MSTGGGQDLVFPHHETKSRRAAVRTALKWLARHWVHNGPLDDAWREDVEVGGGTSFSLREMLDELLRRGGALRADGRATTAARWTGRFRFSTTRARSA